MCFRQLQTLTAVVIILLCISAEVKVNDSLENTSGKVNAEPETENPELITNGKNIVGPEVVYVGKLLL